MPTPNLSWQHDDSGFELQPCGAAWALLRRAPDGSLHRIGTGLYPGAGADAALQRAQALVRLAHPVGVRLVAPDLAHTGNAGGLRLVPPDIAHPRYAQWERSSSSFARDFDIDTPLEPQEGHHGNPR